MGLGNRARRATDALVRRRVLLGGNALREHERRPPSAQTIVDAAGPDWLSRFPDDLQVRAGESPTFDDPRLQWGLPRLEIEGASVLELGPLEGGHSYMAERAGAGSVLAIESNRSAFLRCLATREIAGLTSTRFLCGDFLEYLRSTDERFDVCIASGVLYHLRDPVELLALLADAADRLFIWTHYYDEAILGGSRRFRPSVHRVVGGFEHALHPRPYSRLGLRLASFPGGTERSASWLGREDLLGALAHFGWADVEVGPQTLEAEPGPALSLVARRL